MSRVTTRSRIFVAAICAIAPVLSFAYSGDDAVSTALENLYEFIRSNAIPAMAIGMVGLGGYLMMKGMIALNRFVWFVIGGAIIGGAPSIVKTLFDMF